MAGRIYTLRHTFTNPGQVTLLQVKAPASRPIYIVRARVSQTGTTASTQGTGVQLCRKSAAATVTAAVLGTDIFQTDVSDAASGVQLSTTGTGYLATAEGTDSDILMADGWNLLSTWEYVPVELDERDVVEPGGIIALKFITAAPPSGTYYATLRWFEK